MALGISTGSKPGALAMALPAAGAAVLAATIAGLLMRKRRRTSDLPPQLSFGLPLFGPIIQFLKSPIELIEKGQKELGDCFTVNMIAKTFIFLVGAEAQELFFTNDKYLDQAKMYKFTIPVFGTGILYDVDYSRRICQLGFIKDRLTPECLASYVEQVEKEVVEFFVEEWGDSGEADIRASMIDCVTRTAVACLMGHELRANLDKRIDGWNIIDLLEILEQGLLPFSVFAPNAPIPRHFKRDRARLLMEEHLKPILEERRRKQAAGIADKDFLQRVMNASYPDGSTPDDHEITGFLVATFFGGMHNSSITAAWSCLEVFSRPDLVSELQQEQAEALGSADASRRFTFEGYEKMKLMRSVVTEVLRFHPPLMLLMRTVEEDLNFKQYRLPKGSIVGVCPNVAGTLEGSFAKADDFQPKRFIEGHPTDYSFISFGGGRRLCKGQEFGYMQVMTVLSVLMRTYEIETLDGVTEATFGEGMVIAPSKPCRVKYTRRPAPAAT